MSKWFPNLEGLSGPKYLAIVEAIAADMATGILAAGTRLPPHRDLAWRLKVTVGTVARGYAEAERRGLVTGEVGRGTYIRDSVTQKASLDIYTGADPAPTGMINLAQNLPQTGPVTDMVRQALQSLAASADLGSLLAYRLAPGWGRYPAVAARWLRDDGVLATEDTVSMTGGTQQAVVAALATLTRPGEALAVEELTYPGIMAAASLLGRDVAPVAMDEQGVIPDEVERAFANGAKVFYTVSTVHNPTTATLSDDRRRAIAAIARRYDAMIIEDGVHRFLMPDGPAPIQCHAPERCLYVATFSKGVCPGLRGAFAQVPADLKGVFEAQLYSQNLMPPMALIEVLCKLIDSGEAAAAARWQRQEALERLDIAVRHLGEAVRPASAALNVWLPLVSPWTGSGFMVEAAAHGVRLTPSETFSPGRPRQQAVRVSVSATSRDRLDRGLTSVAQILSAPRPQVGMMV